MALELVDGLLHTDEVLELFEEYTGWIVAQDAAVAAAAMLGLCGERAARAARGPGNLRAALLDAAYTLTPEELGNEAAVRPFEKG